MLHEISLDQKSKKIKERAEVCTVGTGIKAATRVHKPGLFFRIIKSRK
jgi:hypothetical protein